MFDWKSGDDEWEELPTAVTPGKSTHFRLHGRGLLALAALALLVVGGLGLAYRQVNVQVTAVTNTLEQEVMAADRLLVDTAVAGDDELFATLLRRSPAWADAQIRLQAHGDYFDRPPFGLWLDTRADLFATGPVTAPVTATQFTVSPDLTEAELALPMPYVSLDENGELVSLVLQRTAVYRRQANQSWLLAEPDDDFWGEFRQETRPYLNLLTPARDQEIAARLADDLNSWIVRICSDIQCPVRFVLQLRLSTNPDDLAGLHAPVRLSYGYLSGQRTTRLSLPTPTLVGLPVDETGYQTLLRGYATHLAQALVNAYGAETFVIGGIVPPPPDLGEMLSAWGLFAPRPTGFNPIQAAEPPPIPLPDQDILLLCQSSRAPTLFRYDSATAIWADVLLETEGALGFYLTPFPDGQGVALVVGPSVQDERYRLVWLHNGRERLLLTTTDTPIIHSITKLEPGHFLLHFSTSGPDNNDFSEQGIMVSAEDCDDQSCIVQPFTEWAQPSPDGRHTLITRLDENKGVVYALGTAAGEEIQPLENAYDPIWLDGHTLAFRQYSPTATNGLSDTSLMTAVFADDGPSFQIQSPVTPDTIRAAIPELASRREISINSITAYPASQPELLFISIFDWQGNVVRSSHLVQYDWQTHEWTPLNSETLSASWWTVNQYGRYLVIGDYVNAGLRLQVYDIVNEKWQTYETAAPRFGFGGQQSWSDDGNWLILTDTDAVRLIAPAYAYQKVLYHGLDYCEMALWVDRASAGP
jgi:hypothetical protein